MTTPRNPDPSGFNHPEGYSAHNPAGSPQGNGNYGPDMNSPLGNGYGTSNPDSVFSNDYASYPAAGQAGWTGGQEASGYATYPAPTRQNGLALAALITGIVSLFALLFAPLAALLGIAAIILGVLGLRKATQMAPGAERRGMSIAGIVMGAISMLLSIALTAFLGAVMFRLFDSGVIQQCEHLQNDPSAFEACVTDFMENDPNSPISNQ